MPGAVNRPFSANVTEAGRFKPPEALARELGELLDGRSPSQVAAMCGSGVTACHTLLVLESLGLPPGRLYPGSYSQWSHTDRPVAGGR